MPSRVQDDDRKYPGRRLQSTHRCGGALMSRQAGRLGARRLRRQRVACGLRRIHATSDAALRLKDASAGAGCSPSSPERARCARILGWRTRPKISSAFGRESGSIVMHANAVLISRRARSGERPRPGPDCFSDVHQGLTSAQRRHCKCFDRGRVCSGLCRTRARRARDGPSVNIAVASSSTAARASMRVRAALKRPCSIIIVRRHPYPLKSRTLTSASITSRRCSKHPRSHRNTLGARY